MLSHCQVIQVKSLQSCMSGEEGLEKLCFGGVLARTVHFETFLQLISLFFCFTWLLFFPETWNVNLLPFKNKQSGLKAKVKQTKKLVGVIIENSDRSCSVSIENLGEGKPGNGIEALGWSFSLICTFSCTLILPTT